MSGRVAIGGRIRRRQARCATQSETPFHVVTLLTAGRGRPVPVGQTQDQGLPRGQSQRRTKESTGWRAADGNRTGHRR